MWREIAIGLAVIIGFAVAFTAFFLVIPWVGYLISEYWEWAHSIQKGWQ